MNMNKLALRKAWLPLLLLFSITYAQGGDIAPCVAIMNHFDKPALSALFKNKKDVEVIVTSSSPAEVAGCFVQTNIVFTENRFDRVNRDIGSVLLYKFPDSHQLYEEDKNSFMPEGARLNWKQILPQVIEGYVSHASVGYQAFNAYLSNGSYVIFIYKDTPQTKSTLTHLNQRVVDYINVMAQQVIAN